MKNRLSFTYAVSFPTKIDLAYIQGLWTDGAPFPLVPLYFYEVRHPKAARIFLISEGPWVWLFFSLVFAACMILIDYALLS